MARRDSSGNVYYYFGNSFGSATITNSSGTVCYDADFYPFGGELAFTNTCSQNYKFAGMHRDSATGLDHTEYRQYSSNLGRWLSPDPSGMAAVSLTNPQSLNMYAYVTDNPTNLTDALGLDSGAIYVPAIPAQCGNVPAPYSSTCQNDTSGTHVDAMAAAANSNTGCMSGEYGCSGTASDLGTAEAGYASNFVWQVTGTLYGQSVNETFSSLGDYTDWLSSEAALPQNQIYEVFAAMCQNVGCDPNAAVTLGYQFKNAVYNVTWKGATLDTGNLDSYWEDPFTFMHGGDQSWFQGSPLSMFSVVHLIDGSDLEGHLDPFGALNPFHYIFQFPAMLFPAGGSGTASCSFNGGCTVSGQ